MIVPFQVHRRRDITCGCRALHFPFHMALLVLGACGVLYSFQACEIFAQQATPTDPDAVRVFPRVPRELTRHFELVQEKGRDKNYADTAVELSAAMAQLSYDDYLVSDGDSGIAGSFRTSVLRQVASLDSTVFEHVEQMDGVQARALLDDAIATRDIKKLSDCSQRWSLTRAGQEASLLLARIDLDLNRPIAALRRLQDLFDINGDRSRDAEQLILFIVALSRTGRVADADKKLEELRNRYPESSIRAGDVELAGNDLARLFKEYLPSESLILSQSKFEGDWLFFRGDQMKTPVVACAPWPMKMQWKQPLVPNENAIRTWRESTDPFESSSPPIASPLLVGDQLIARDLQSVHGLRSSDGQLIWSYPPPTPPPRKSKEDLEDHVRATRIATEIGQRLWHENSFGRFSSDGRRVFVIEPVELEAPPRPPDPFGGLVLFGPSSEMNQVECNRLVALNLQREGAVEWIVGDVSGVAEPTLADARFLCAPLPVDGTLYSVVRVKTEVRLVALNADTGRLSWTLPLAFLDSDALVNVVNRQMLGTSPVFSEGLLICQTYVGSLVAVDVSRRRFLWGVQYRDPRRVVARRRPAVPVPPMRDESMMRRWCDPDIMVHDANVLVSGDGEYIWCLDLHTGKTRWKRDRRDTMYTAVVGPNQLLLLGESRFTSIKIRDGSYSWNDAFVAIPSGGSAFGRGLFDGSHFYLPTSDPELLKISVADGKIAQRIETTEPLGNLVTNGKDVFSQSEKSLVAFQLGADDSSPAKPTMVAADGSVKAPDFFVAKFGSGKFADRETATKSLLPIAAAGIPALQDGAGNSNAEIAFRSTSILVDLLDAADVQVASSARAALVSATFANSNNRISVNGYERESRRRGQQAIKALERLGAVVKENGRFVSLPPTWQGKHEGLSHLVWLTQLESLELRHPTVNDLGIAYLAGLPNLKSLNLNRSSITNEGLRFLGELPKLETLLLQGTSIDDAANKYLSNLTELKAINLTGTKLTNEGVAELQKTQPALKILR